MMIKKIHHIGFVVADLAGAEKKYQAGLSLSFEKILRMPEYFVDIGIIRIGEVLLEFICPTSPQSRFSPFLKEHGEGFHHIAYEVPNIREAVKRIMESGVQPEAMEPIRGVEGLICFVKPGFLGGVYTELLEVYGNPEQR